MSGPSFGESGSPGSTSYTSRTRILVGSLWNAVSSIRRSLHNVGLVQVIQPFLIKLSMSTRNVNSMPSIGWRSIWPFPLPYRPISPTAISTLYLPRSESWCKNSRNPREYLNPLLQASPDFLLEIVLRELARPDEYSNNVPLLLFEIYSILNENHRVFHLLLFKIVVLIFTVADTIAHSLQSLTMEALHDLLVKANKSASASRVNEAEELVENPLEFEDFWSICLLLISRSPKGTTVLVESVAAVKARSQEPNNERVMTAICGALLRQFQYQDISQSELHSLLLSPAGGVIVDIVRMVERQLKALRPVDDTEYLVPDLEKLMGRLHDAGMVPISSFSNNAAATADNVNNPGRYLECCFLATSLTVPMQTEIPTEGSYRVRACTFPNLIITIHCVASRTAVRRSGADCATVPIVADQRHCIPIPRDPFVPCRRPSCLKNSTLTSTVRSFTIARFGTRLRFFWYYQYNGCSSVDLMRIPDDPDLLSRPCILEIYIPTTSTDWADGLLAVHGYT